MSVTRRVLRRVAAERGQAIIMFVGIFTIIALVAAVTIDFGLWFSERRGAQKDADLIALAGAYELLEDTAGFSDVESAVGDATLANGIDPADDVHNLDVKSLTFPAGFDGDPAYCHDATDGGGRPNAVVLDIDHESSALFSNIYRGLGGQPAEGAPAIGAHACARAGSLRSTTGLRPWIVSMFNSPCFEQVDDDGDGVVDDDDEYQPRFRQNCVFRFESPSSQVGSIRIGDDEGDVCNEPGGGAAKYRENIVEGAGALCSIGDLVDTEPGLNVGPTVAALADLLAGEGECDAKNGQPNGIDEFLESFDATSDIPSSQVTFVERDCTTPRAVHLVIIDEFDGTGFDTRPIRGFAAFFLEQCEKLDNAGLIIAESATCEFSGPGGSSSIQVRGFFMSVLELEGDIGDFDTFGTKVIRLVE